MNEEFPKYVRLSLQRDFDRVFKAGSVVVDHVLVIHGVRNELRFSRMGISVSRKLGGAVLRNRWKRLLREAFRNQSESLPKSIDFVVRPRRGAVEDRVAIIQSLPSLLRRLDKALARQS